MEDFNVVTNPSVTPEATNAARQKAHQDEQFQGAYWIKRSMFGHLRICFYAGPSYPEMITDLQHIYKRFGSFIGSGERLSGRQWLARIIATDTSFSAREIQALMTLMPGTEADELKSDASVMREL